MARNVAHQEGRAIRDFATAVFDLAPIQGDIRTSCPRPIPAIISGPTKPSWCARWPMAAPAFYFRGDHRATFPALRRAILEAA
jgi:hypothetical protein